MGDGWRVGMRRFLIVEWWVSGREKKERWKEGREIDIGLWSVYMPFLLNDRILGLQNMN